MNELKYKIFEYLYGNQHDNKARVIHEIKMSRLVQHLLLQQCDRDVNNTEMLLDEYCMFCRIRKVTIDDLFY